MTKTGLIKTLKHHECASLLQNISMLLIEVIHMLMSKFVENLSPFHLPLSQFLRKWEELKHLCTIFKYIINCLFYIAITTEMIIKLALKATSFKQSPVCKRPYFLLVLPREFKNDTPILKAATAPPPRNFTFLHVHQSMYHLVCNLLLSDVYACFNPFRQHRIFPNASSQLQIRGRNGKFSPLHQKLVADTC